MSKIKIVEDGDNFKIELEENQIIDLVNSDLSKGLIVLSEKEITFETITKEILYRRETFYIDKNGGIDKLPIGCSIVPHNCYSSKEESEFMLAYLSLMRVAKFLNKKSNNKFKIGDIKYCHRIDDKNKLTINSDSFFTSSVYFETEDIANLATKILGETQIRKALLANC